MNTHSQSSPITPSTFEDRANLYLHKAAHIAQSWYDCEGNWIASSSPANTRERYWICCGLYSQGQNDLANAVILRGSVTKSHMGWQNPSSFDIFHTNIACVLLVLYLEQMSIPVCQQLEALVEEGFSFEGNRRADYQFHGNNDNMQAKATMGMILGGEMLNNLEAVEHGLWNLRQLRNMLVRRGTHSEWNSPTYSPATIAAMGKIAHYAKHPEAQELAAGIEERLWLDLAARFHPEAGVMAGPYTRSYTIDLIAHASSVSALLWFVLGDISKPSPMEMFHLTPGIVLHHEGDIPFNISQKCWFAVGSYHPSARALDLFINKTYPFHAMATAEMGGSKPDNLSRPVRIETFIERDFTVGTSSTHYSNADQAAPYFVTYKRTPEVKSFTERSTVYHKFTINDDVPGTIKAQSTPEGHVYSNSDESSELNSYCAVQTIQAGPSAMILTHPRLALGGLEEQPPRPITRLSELVIFPSHFGGADEIRVGNRERTSWSGKVTRGEWIGCRRGQLLIALRPLAYSRTLGLVQITLEKINHYEVLRTTFYQGMSRTFTRAELRDTLGGFIAEHASISEYPSLTAFMDDLAKSTFSDYSWMTRRTRYRRPGGKMRSALELEVSWAPGSSLTRHALCNGIPVSWDKPLQIDGFIEADFPFFKESWKPVQSYFPWKKLEANWDTGSGEGFIGEIEKG